MLGTLLPLLLLLLLVFFHGDPATSNKGVCFFPILHVSNCTGPQAQYTYFSLWPRRSSNTDNKFVVSSEHFCHRRPNHRNRSCFLTAHLHFEPEDKVIYRGLFARLLSKCSIFRHYDLLYASWLSLFIWKTTLDLYNDIFNGSVFDDFFHSCIYAIMHQSPHISKACACKQSNGIKIESAKKQTRRTKTYRQQQNAIYFANTKHGYLYPGNILNL